MKRRLLVILTLAIAALAVPQPAATDQAATCDFADVVVFATNSAWLKQNSDVLSGDVVVNDASPGPYLTRGKELTQGLGTTTPAGYAVKADTVKLKSSGVIGGDLHYNTAGSAINGTVEGNLITPLSLPVFAPADLPPFHAAEIRPDAEDIVVPIGGSIVLDAGDYGDVTVKKNGVVTFTGGVYNMRSINGGISADLLFEAPSEVRIEGKFDSDQNAVIGGAPGFQVDASEIVFYVGGSNGNNGKLGSTPKAAQLGLNSTVNANFYVPNGTLWIRQNASATGAFIARDTILGIKAEATLDSAFSNQPPAASGQEVQTDGANDLVITLEGSDPEGDDLAFSIAVPPAEGSLGAVSPITPAQVQQCSESAETCTVDATCPGYLEGETCDTAQPPISQATVTYSPDSQDCVTDPESGEVTCPEDFFTFQVTDACGAIATAIVSVNGGSDEIPDDPGPGTAVVDAEDDQVDTIVDAVSQITLSAAAPVEVESLTLRIDSLPAGTLTDSDGNDIGPAPYVLPSPVVSYKAPSNVGVDSFAYSAYDSTTTGSPCGPPSCDTAAVNIDIGDPPALAGVGQELNLNLNATIVFNLEGNSGGVAGGGQAPQSAGAIEITAGNGPPMSGYQLRRIGAMKARPGLRAPAPLAPTALIVDEGWLQFGWCDESSLAAFCSETTTISCTSDNDCPGAETCVPETCASPVTLTDLQNETAVIDGPFTFTTSVDSCLKVTDTLAKGDHWRVEEHSDPQAIDLLGFTREVDQSTVGTTSDPDVAFADPEYSSGEFELIADTDYEIQLITIPPDSFAWGTAGFLRVDTGRCDQMIWTITALPTTGTVTDLTGGQVFVGQTFTESPTLVFTSSVAGTFSLGYDVAQGAVVGSSFVDFLVSPTDECILVGREVGCAPGGGGEQAPGQGGGGGSDEGLTTSSTNSGVPSLRVVVEGAGTVASSRFQTVTGDSIGLSCDRRCGADFRDGSEVTLYARPVGDESKFLGWGGDCGGSEPITTIVVTGHRQCTAIFGRN